MSFTPKKVVVIAPHPDDETLGAGGAIARFASEGAEVSVLVVSGHLPPIYKPEVFEETVREAEYAFRIMGVTNWEFMRIPALQVHAQPVPVLNGGIMNFVRKHAPDTVLMPFPDRHIDHRAIFDACAVAVRPIGEIWPRTVLCYETLSETHWNVGGIEPSFIPDFFIDITASLTKKQAALEAYASQIAHAPTRSVEACTALAKFRGSQNGCGYAEAFKVVRIVV